VPQLHTPEDMSEGALARQGRLWSFTVQGFEPKTPCTGEGPFSPHGVG